MSGTDPEQVLEFWIGPCDDAGLPSPASSRRWFAGGAEFDAEVCARFGDMIEAALDGELDGWADTPRGRLALVILLDQMTRNAFRGRARAFAGDARALALVREALRAEEDRELTPIERYFLYMPLMHAEDAAAQQECVARFRDLAVLEPDPERGLLAGGARWAESHRTEIERFGRFPGRNEALGRESTDEERAFLARKS